MNQLETTKQQWVRPKLTEINTGQIQQQEEELLYQLLNSDSGFKLLSGSAA